MSPAFAIGDSTDGLVVVEEEPGDSDWTPSEESDNDDGLEEMSL